MKLQDYLIDSVELDWSSLLEEWRWLLPPEFTVWFLTRAGDLFLTLPNGSILMLDTGLGELREVAANREEACAKLDLKDVAAEWLQTVVVDQLVSSGCLLSAGQCYGYKLLPLLGGTFSPEGRLVLSVREHLGVTGSLHNQLAGLPDGSKVELKVTD